MSSLSLRSGEICLSRYHWQLYHRQSLSSPPPPPCSCEKHFICHCRDRTTQHLLYLQLRRDVIEDRLRADEQELITLAALALQAEYGDYSIRKNRLSYFVINYYFPERLDIDAFPSSLSHTCADELRLICGGIVES